MFYEIYGIVRVFYEIYGILRAFYEIYGIICVSMKCMVSQYVERFKSYVMMKA